MADKLCAIAIKHSIHQNIVGRPAETLPELKSAYHLTYKEYLARGYCEKHPSELHYSFFCVLPNTRTFLLERKDKLLGTLTLIVDSPCGLPMESLFPTIVENSRREGRRLAEVGLLALDQDAFRKKSFLLTDFEKLTGSFWLFKIMFEYARRIAGVTDMLIAVHPKHEALYRYLTFEPLGIPLPYPSACGKLALPMRLDIEKARKNTPKSSPLRKYFFDLRGPVEILEKHFEWNHEVLQEFLMDTHPLWDKMPDKYRQYLKSCYPDFHP
jgi:hypothetical protein